jgi:hypothetical protein
MTKKIVREILFIASPAVLALLVSPLLKNVPKFPYVTILGSLMSLVLIVAVLLNVEDRALLVLRGALIGVLYLFWLKGTLFGFEGFFWDNRYYALAVERFYHSFLPYSQEYKYIHFSLPPLLFFIIGRIGALFKVALPTLLKASSFLFVIYLPYIWGYGLKGLFKEKNWMAAFLLSLLVPFKTYESWYGSLGTIAQKGVHITGIFLMIVWYVWVRQKKVPFWKAGLVAGIFFAVDYYPFMIIFIAVLFEIAGIILGEKRIKEGASRLLYYTKIAGIVVCVNLIWLGPVVLDLIKNTWGTSYNGWFDISGASLLNVVGLFDGFDLLSIVLIAGLVNIFLNLSDSPDMKPVKALFVALIAFLCLAYVLSFWKFSFLFADVSLFLVYLLGLGSVFLILHFGKKSLAVVLLVIVSSTAVLNQREQNSGLLDYSETSSVRYRRGEVLRGSKDFKDAIVFPYVNELIYGGGAYSFISPVMTYSDIAASFEERLEYVRSLAALLDEGNGLEFYRRLKKSPYGQASFLLFKKDRQSGLLTFDIMVYLNDLKYPGKSGRRSVLFSFEPGVLDTNLFEKIHEDHEFVVYSID